MQDVTEFPDKELVRSLELQGLQDATGGGGAVLVVGEWGYSLRLWSSSGSQR